MLLLILIFIIYCTDILAYLRREVLRVISPLYQRRNVLRQTNVLRQQPPRTQQEVFAVHSLAPGVQLSKRPHDQAARHFQPMRSDTGMPVQTADTLQQQIHRAQIRDQQIKIQIQ